MELLKKQRLAVQQTAQIEFRNDSLFRLEIEGQPDGLDLFVDNVSYGKGSVETKSLEVATGEINQPEKKTAGSVTVVFKDNELGQVSDFISFLAGLIFNEDGTRNLPVHYLKRLKIYRILSDGREFLEYEKDVYVEDNNDYEGNVSKVNEFGTFTATFRKYRSIGGLIR